jgi:RimJ/RimL family protein N-acetyltransferase
MIPTLTTARLTLRAPRGDDFAGFAAFFASDRARFVGGPVDEGTAWRHFAANVGQWHLTGYGMWIAEEREAQRAVGLVGLFHPQAWIAREIAWMITDPAAEGRGLAAEAARAARGWAHAEAGWTEVFSVIDPANARSVALARRLGCRIERRTEFEGRPLDLWRHPGPEALQ